MKFLLSLTVLFSVSAFACPDIAGQYTCKSGTMFSSREITQIDNGFHIKFNGKEQDYPVDGTISTLPDNDSMKDAKYTSVCDGGNFVVKFTAALMYEGVEVAKEVQTTTYFMKNDQLNIIQKTKAKGLPLPKIEYICNKN
jgi:hypothetical protein